LHKPELSQTAVVLFEVLVRGRHFSFTKISNASQARFKKALTEEASSRRITPLDKPPLYFYYLMHHK